MRYDLSGQWTIKLADGREKIDGFLPGTLDENKMGNPDKVAKAWHPDVEERNKNLDKGARLDPRIATRLSRNYTYEGAATFTRVFHGKVLEGRRYFLFAERARKISLRIDGVSAPCVRTGLSAPSVFEVTGLLRDGSVIEITSDNTYPGLPYRDITFSSAATDETATNWNGVVGELYIEEKEVAFIDSVRIYPEADGANTISGEITLCDWIGHQCIGVIDDAHFGKNGQNSVEVEICLEGECLKEKLKKKITLFSGASNGFHFSGIELSDKALFDRWDEYEGKLHTIKATLSDTSGKILDSQSASFGIRKFSYDSSGRLTLNGRRIFLRSEANCALFPETGHPPMDKESWLEIMKTYSSYGVNCVRCHSWCPPEAAFSAADELGMLVQAELPNWNPRDAFSSGESRSFYENEIVQIVKTYANHPSFVMLTLGNELHTDYAGIEEMHHLMDIAREIDPTRLYAWGSNNFYGAKGTDEASDFYTSSNCGEDVLRLAVAGNNGRINKEAPNTKRDFSESMKRLREEYKKPFFSFEVGQYEILPDMHELAYFKGVTRPDNLQIVRDRQRAAGLTDEEYDKRVAATGELSLLAYREEVETVLRTPEMSGISLLGLQDFTGQGTALVGMLNSHLKPKEYPFAESNRFKNFFDSTVLLVLMDKYTYEVGDTFRVEVKVANYGKESLFGPVEYSFKNSNEYEVDGCEGKSNIDGSFLAKGSIGDNIECKAGELTSLGYIESSFANIQKPTRLSIVVSMRKPDNSENKCDSNSTDKLDSYSGLNRIIKSEYPIWVYPKVTSICPEDIYETETLDEKALDILEKGGKVYYSPLSTKEAIPNSIKAQFSTDFWSVGTFPFQEGAMGQLIDDKHPIFSSFPTEFHSNWQWFHMASQRAFILPRYMKTIVAEMDCYVTLRPMAQLFEVKCGKGRMLLSSLGLQNLQQYPEARALLNSIFNYMESGDFNPQQTVSLEELYRIIHS